METHPLIARIAEVGAEINRLERKPGPFGGPVRQEIARLSIRRQALEEAARLVGFQFPEE